MQKDICKSCIVFERTAFPTNPIQLQRPKQGRDPFCYYPRMSESLDGRLTIDTEEYYPQKRHTNWSCGVNAIISSVKIMANKEGGFPLGTEAVSSERPR